MSSELLSSVDREVHEPQRPSFVADGRHCIDLIRRDVPLTPETSILEVGCGYGLFTYHLAQSCHVHGVDVSIDDLRLNPVRDVSLMDGTRLAFADESFDVVLAHHVLHHIVDQPRALSEMVRVARRYVVIADLNRWNPVNRYFVAIGAEDMPDPYFTARQLSGVFERAGLRVLRRRTWGFMSPFLTPRILVPLQRLTQFEHPLGLEHLLVGEKV
ncbi:MAG: class I SAM-dependent methyltransferase [Chloroflexota bacterium]